jgi:helicase MOV-10
MRPNPLKPEEIGVISPYNKQVQKIRWLLQHEKALNLSAVKVGSTELFQGQERTAIIISTVRSKEEYIGFDLKHNLGFLQNPKRFNVASTRAQAMLIVVGNPGVLAVDPCWGGLLQRCIRLKAYVGVSYTPTTEMDVDTLAADLDALLLDNEEEESTAEGATGERMLQEGMEMPTFD